MVEITIETQDLLERKADSRGRVKLPQSEFAGKKVEIAVVSVEEDEEEARLAD